jgi:SNF2 family DNA or RNA helicase
MSTIETGVPDRSAAGAASPSRLRDLDLAPHYSHEDGDLVDLFFVPALSCSTLYRRVTGYFNAEALALAARGLNRLIERRGRMELVVGCTLEPDEVESIEAGYELRNLFSKGLHKRLMLAAEDTWSRERLGWVAWMVAHRHLDVKLAIPKDAEGKFRAGLGLYHAKAGLLTDGGGDRLVFTGSINETNAGWKVNCESFDVSCSWRGEWDLKRVELAEAEFTRLWTNTAKSAEVMDVPEAVRQQLLEFLPTTDVFVTPPVQNPVVESEEIAEPEVEEPVVVAEPQPDDGERRKRVWGLIRDAAKRPDGALVAVKTSAVEPWPHQLRAYKRMLDAWPFRLLIADEVGLGKTIEAGLIIRHAWLAGWAKRILIMAPKGLLRQWQAELYEKFNLLVPIYTGQSLVWPEHHFRQGPLEEKVGRPEWTEQPIVLASSHLMRRKERQKDLLDAQGWDLLVLDEAHHARRRGAGTAQEKGPNRLLALMQGLKDKAASLLLMTATPMQVHPVEIWDLLALLGLPPEWTQVEFLEYFETLAKNPDEKGLQRAARLLQTTERDYGKLSDKEVERLLPGVGLIDRKRVLSALREPKSLIPFKQLSTRQRKAAVALLKASSPIRHRMSRHTRPLLREYAKKGLLKSPIADREVQDIAVEMAPAERALYEAVEDYISTTYQAADAARKNAVGFVMTVYRRRVASSFFALRRTLEKKLEMLAAPQKAGQDEERLEEDAPQDDVTDEVISVEDAAELEQKALAVEQRESIQGLLKQIAKLGTDTKALKLIEELEAAFADGYEGAIVFTQYADTMEYLKDFLADRIELPMGTYSGSGGQRRGSGGSWSTCTKEEIKRLLRAGEIKVLVCTDAAGEGLNLQSVGVLVNFDLPWNPMKVEQRIGRIDRIGQKYPKVRIVNLAYADTVEADVYFTLRGRIGLFENVVGKLQPILSRLPREFEAAVLGRAAGRPQAKDEALSHVLTMVDEAEQAGFNIDEVSDADLVPPEFPEPPFEPEDLDTVLRREDLLPLGVECNPLEPCTYALRLPGDATAARVTTRPSIFDDHFQSHQLLLPDSPLFRRMVSAAGAQEDLEPCDTIMEEFLIA